MKTQLRLETFEDRLVPAVTIDSGHEAYAWVFINELRANPSAFADNLQGLIDNTVTSAFGFTNTDPVISDLRRMKQNGNQTNYADSLALMRGTAARGPFAWEEILEDRAGVHNEWMKVNGFSHTGQTGGGALPGYSNNPNATADVYGYPAGRYSAWGENIGYGAGQLSSTKGAYNQGTITLDGFKQRAAFLDSVGYMLELYSGSLGHLQNLLYPDFGTSGFRLNSIGLDIDLYEASGYETIDSVPEAEVSTHRPAYYHPNGTGGFIAGSIFRDANGNNFFDIGEGALVTVDARTSGGVGFTTTLAAAESGAFSEYVANGTYTVTISASGQTLSTQTVTVSDNNKWVGVNLDAVQPPGQPTVTAPIAAQSNLRPTVTWNAVNNADTYQVRIDNVSTGVNNIQGANPTGTNWTPTADLVSGQSYRVYVRAFTQGVPGAWSTANAFSVAKPSQTGPATGVLNLRPQFTWAAITGSAGYDVRLDDVTGNKTNIFPGTHVTAANWTPATDLISGRTYKWMVRSTNSANLGAWTTAATFSVGKPAISAPANLANIRPTVTWSAVTGAAGYRVQINDVSGARANLFPNTTVAGTSWAPPADLVSGRTYRVYVKALNAAGVAYWSAPVTFAVSRPTPTGPIGDVSGPRPSFAWSAIAGVATYQVQVNDLTTGKAKVFVVSTANTSWMPPSDLVTGHRYRWFVRALNSAGIGAWASADFRVV